MIHKISSLPNTLVYTESKDASGAKFYMLYSEALWYTANFQTALAMSDKAVQLEPENLEARNFRTAQLQTFKAHNGKPILKNSQSWHILECNSASHK